MKKGFTLIEALVIIAIIGILLAMVIGSLNCAYLKKEGKSCGDDTEELESKEETVGQWK